MQETENRAINKAERIADNNSNLISTEEVMLPSRKTAKRISLGENKKMSAKRRKAKARLREQNRLKKEKAKIILSRQKRIKQEV